MNAREAARATEKGKADKLAARAAEKERKRRKFEELVKICLDSAHRAIWSATRHGDYESNTSLDFLHIDISNEEIARRIVPTLEQEGFTVVQRQDHSFVYLAITWGTPVAAEPVESPSTKSAPPNVTVPQPVKGVQQRIDLVKQGIICVHCGEPFNDERRPALESRSHCEDCYLAQEYGEEEAGDASTASEQGISKVTAALAKASSTKASSGCGPTDRFSLIELE